MGHMVLILITPTPTTLAQEQGQRKLATWMQTKKIEYKEIDAINDKPARKELTAISGIKGNYPQVFITDGESETRFVGGFEEIQSMVELDDVDEAVLANAPDLKTFKKVFADCKSD